MSRLSPLAVLFLLCVINLINFIDRGMSLLSLKELNSEIWGKGVCDIWEKWVVWVEK